MEASSAVRARVTSHARAALVQYYTDQLFVFVMMTLFGRIRIDYSDHYSAPKRMRIEYSVHPYYFMVCVLYLLRKLYHGYCMQVHIKDENKSSKKKLADGWEKLATNSAKSSESAAW